MANLTAQNIIDVLAQQNKLLSELIEENKRLKSTPFEMTGAERLAELQEETKKLEEQTKKYLDVVNEKLGTNYKDIFEYQKDIEEQDKKRIELIKKQEEIQKKGRYKGKAKELREIKEELKKLDEAKQLREDNIDAINELDKCASNYLKKANRAQEQLNKRIVEGTHKINDFNEKWEQRTRAFKKGFNELGQGIKQIHSSLTKTLEPWSKANQEAMTYAKTMGMSKKTADAFLDKTVSWAAKNDIGLLFNKTTDELIKMQSKYSEVLGRNVQLTSEQKKDMLAMETFLGEDGMMDIANNLENFGLGMSDSAEFIKKTIDDATKSGIVASKLTKTIRENIKMAQNYTFKNGLDGLTSMAKKAIQLKTDMSLVNGFLEKTSTVEGAITTGAQLQVLGGNYALGSDPLSMMYESLNDMEGLFDRAVGMVQGKVFYNNATGNFEMGAMDRYMMKQAATAMGIDPSKLIDVAFRKASLNKIEGQIKANSNISGDAEMVEMVKNLATWDKGKGVVNINGKDKEIKDLTAEDKTYLEQMQKTDSQNLQEMAINLRSVKEKLEGVGKEINNEQADYISWFGQQFDGLLNNTKGLNNLAQGGALFNILGGATGILTGVWSTAAGVWRIAKGVRNVIRREGSDIEDISIDKKSNTPKAKGVKGVKRFKELWKKSVNSPTGRKMLKKSAGKYVGNVLKTGAKLGGKALGSVGMGVLELGSSAISGELQKDPGFVLARAGISTAAGVIGTYFGGPYVGMLCSTLADGATRLVQEGIKKQRQKLRDEIANKLSSTNPEIAGLFSGDNALQGNYSKKGLRRIEQSLSDGVLDENDNLGWFTKRKLRKNDDLERIHKTGIDVKIPLASGGYLEGKSHIEGGMPILGSNISVEGGEFVINKEATKRNLPLLTEINNGNYDMTSKEPLGKIMKVKKHNYTDGMNMPHNSNMKIDPISINLSGTIKLDGGNKQVDISNEILNNPILITKLTEMINKQLNILDNGAYNKGVFKQKFT